MPQHEQFDVFDVQAAQASNKRAQHNPDGRGRERRRSCRRSSHLLAPTTATPIGALQEAFYVLEGAIELILCL